MAQTNYTVSDTFNMLHVRKFAHIYNMAVMQDNIPYNETILRQIGSYEHILLYEVPGHIPEKSCSDDFIYLRRILFCIKYGPNEMWSGGITLYQMTQLNKLYKKLCKRQLEMTPRKFRKKRR